MRSIFKGIVLFILVSAASCTKYVDIDPAAQLLQTESVFSTEHGVTAAVNGVYSGIRAGTPSLCNGSITLFCGLSVGEIYNTASSATYDPFIQNMIQSDNSTILLTFWNQPYNMIYRCNLILEGIAKANDLNTKFKDQIKGEMLVMRSLIYFYLTNVYRDVPLILRTDYLENSVMARTNQEQIYQQLITDLVLAKQLLVAGYPTAGKTRINGYAAMALLARVYLFHQDYQKSIEIADQIINSGVYTLTTDLTKTFLINSTETILEIAPPGEMRNTAEAGLFVPTSTTARPTFAVSNLYVNAFSDNDKRKTNWLAKNVNASITYYYPSKYKNRVSTSITEYDIVFRLAELYLIKAECEAQLDHTNLSVNSLNKIRARAGLVDLGTNIGKTTLLDEILRERQREFLAEWGHRWLDLKRLDMINQVMAVEKPGFQSYKQWYPIPYQQMLYNYYLTQNEGYD